MARKPAKILPGDSVPWWTVNSAHEIQSRDVIRETEKWLFFTYGRSLKVSRLGRWFRTRAEAVEHLRFILTDQVRYAKQRLRRAREEYQEFNAREARIK